MKQTVACPICGKPYVLYAFYAGDQSACGDCRTEARQETCGWNNNTQEVRSNGNTN